MNKDGTKRVSKFDVVVNDNMTNATPQEVPESPFPMRCKNATTILLPEGANEVRFFF
jgi:hypothetical protein